MRSLKTPNLGLVGLLTATAVAVAGLHRLGGIPAFIVDWSDPVAWVDRAPAEATIAATLRYLGLGLGYWMLVSTVLYSLASALRPGHSPGWIRLVTLPAVRAVVDRAVATTLALSIVAAPIGPAAAVDGTGATVAPVHQTVADGIPVPHITLAEDGPPAATGTPGAAPPVIQLDQPIPLVTTSAAEPVDSSNYQVESGDNLWAISAAHLETAGESVPTLEAVDRYWRAVIATNQDTLRSGDPNLIYPGEIITLPAIEPVS